jgi:hypothetical protein
MMYMEAPWNRIFEDDDEAEDAARAHLKQYQEKQQNARLQQNLDTSLDAERPEVIDMGKIQRASREVQSMIAKQSASSEMQLGFRVSAPDGTDDSGNSRNQEVCRLPSVDSTRGRMVSQAARGNHRSRHKKLAQTRNRIEEDPVHSFTPMEPHQPLMYENMRLAPGVGLQEGSKAREAKQRSFAGRMTRQEYEQQVISGVWQTASAAQLDRIEDSPGAKQVSRSASTPATSPLSKVRQTASPKETQKTSFPPVSLQQPRAPTLDVRWQQRFKTLGFQTGGRERIPTSGTQAYRRHSFRCIGAQPVIGATMGHGLVPYVSQSDWF